jgi:hypothetical protein
MAYNLPNGSTFDFASAYAAAKTVTTISNANPAVASSTAHGYAEGDIIVLTSAWSKLTNRPFRVGAVTADTFALEGVDTTNTQLFPSGTGQGAGSAKEVTSWVQLAQITEVAFTGGEQQFLTFAFLEDTDEKQMPTSKSAVSLTLTVADDPAQAYVPVVEQADFDVQPRVQRLNMVNGDVILYNSIATISSTPTLNRDELMTRDITLSLQGRITRYAAN